MCDIKITQKRAIEDKSNAAFIHKQLPTPPPHHMSL